MTVCQEAGCGGTIAADGYCDTCGAKGQLGAAASRYDDEALAAPVAEKSTSAAGGVCGRDGCVGRIAADGYCDICGLSSASTGAVSTGVGGGGSADSFGGASQPSLGAPTAPTTSAQIRSTDASMAQSRRTVAQSVRTATAGSRIGAGLVSIKPTSVGDPSLAVMTDEEIEAELGEVAEEERFCSSCGKPVGRSTAGGPGRLTGYCGSCRAQFDFVTNHPSLRAGELVAGQYQIVGALAHGGMGWIYLGQDRAVSDRWVVLKGLLNENDADAVAAAVAERRFLAQIEHANIVNIYNFVTHRGAGYIVMEMVGGQSLNSKLKARREANGGVPNPLPVTDAISYVLGVLPAFEYLHERGLVYNDLKPANIMAVGDEVKLIDLGAVMRIDDHQAAIFGTPGFQAPEVAAEGPSIASDLYTVGRTLAVLTLQFVFHQGRFEYALPPVAEAPTLGRWESLHRFLLRATAAHPDDRFQTAGEMADQLTGVLREIVALSDGRPRPVTSQLFEGDQLVELLVSGSRQGASSSPDADLSTADWRLVPPTRIDEEDPSAPLLMGLPEGDPVRAAQALRAGMTSGQTAASAEVMLRLAWEDIKILGLGIGEGAPEQHLKRVEQLNPWDWRVDWYRSIDLLRRGLAAEAAEGFSRVWTELPGETAPKLALAVAAEMAEEWDRARALYDLVIGTDSSYVSAAFGLARCSRALDDHTAVVEAYNRVPTSSAAHTSAQTEAVKSLIGGTGAGVPSVTELLQASATMERLQLDAADKAGLTAQLYERALAGLRQGSIQPQEGKMLGIPLQERALRRGLEKAYRLQARLARDSAQRVHLVELANAVRPRSIL